jgi:UDP-N-acetylglucosamine 2-epimerase (non-hydrolysing)
MLLKVVRMKVAIILGTRPEIIKMSPVIRECEKQGIKFFILHTGQHYSSTMDSIFFEELDLPPARYNLGVGSGTHAGQTARMLVGLEETLLQEVPDVILVQGDTNTVLAGALTATKLHIAVGHVEAGLRSYDRSMPEEINRVVADHLSDYLFAPTMSAKRILLAEGIPERQIAVTGNTIVDAVTQNLQIALRRKSILKKLALQDRQYFLVTVHRQENVDCRQRLAGALRGLEWVHREYHMPVILPVHPRAERRLAEFGLDLPDGVRGIEPLGYLDFLQLEAQAALLLTDSGGIQEEACILQVPCVTLRENTERPETLEVGSNVLAGADPQVILHQVRGMLHRERVWANPFGDGKAGERIVSIIVGRIGIPTQPEQIAEEPK